MSDPQDTSRIAGRAHLLPEEIAAGSDDPQAQAEAILADSDRRTASSEETSSEAVTLEQGSSEPGSSEPGSSE